MGFCDESAFTSKPNNKRVLNTKVVRHKTDNRKITVFGAMLLNGKDVAMLSERSKSEDFIRFLGAVRSENPGNPLVLILDNARIHHAKIVKPVCSELDVWLVYLPPYSPDLNPIEFAWKDGKKNLAMHGFEEIEEMAKKTVESIMTERKHSYARDWTASFIVPRGS
ncbi:MAG: IS630 family transposase [Thermodesulfobacteriota bacterium]